MSYRTDKHVVFVKNGAGGYSRQELAQVLLGAADEFGLDPSSVFAERDGFSVTEDLYDAIENDGGLNGIDDFEADDEADDEAEGSEQGTEQEPVEEPVEAPQKDFRQPGREEVTPRRSDT